MKIKWGRQTVRVCIVCGKELKGSHTQFCGPICSAMIDTKKRTKFANTLTERQLRHWCRTGRR